MPDEQPVETIGPDKSNSATTDEAERIAHDAVDALQNLVESAGDLTADTAKLVVSAAHDVVAKIESLMRKNL